MGYIENNLLVNEKKERIAYLDLLRIIAIFAVIMIHTSASYVVSYNNKTIEFIIGNIFDSISRLGVPLFLMISGALMLNEQRVINYKKQIVNLIVIFLIWSLSYAVVFHICLPLIRNESVSVKSILINFFCGHYHLWYMFAIVGLYLITPILRTFVKIKNSKIILYFILLSLLFQFTKPMIEVVFEEINFLNSGNAANEAYADILNKINLDFIGGFTTYYLAGWYIANIEISKKHSIILYVIGIISIISIILLTQIFPNQYNRTYSNENILVFFYALAVFLFVKSFYKPNKENKLLTVMSKLTFGTYLIHIFILSVISKILLKNVFCIPLVWLITTLLCFIITFIISKIPFVKKIIKT